MGPYPVGANACLEAWPGTAMGMSAPLHEPDAVVPVTTGEELAHRLAAQHEELREEWCRVPRLHAGAREDVFLHARRRLAVHVALEHAVLGPRLDSVREAEAELDREVVAAEGEEPESLGFDAACARVAVSFLRHSATVDEHVLAGVLPDDERQAVAAALALWDGAGDAYLGNTWSEMRETAVAQITRAG
ncbi:hypothetical protein ASG94_20690 [Nocardioides sp. Soil805]|nr:hypothetical protein ASG94_20690 [Nocardioides sp. Soil805]